MLDAFGREQDPDESDVEVAEVAATPSYSSVSRVFGAFGREQNPDQSQVEDAEAAATSSHSNVSRGELLSRIRNGFDDLVVSIGDSDK